MKLLTDLLSHTYYMNMNMITSQSIDRRLFLFLNVFLSHKGGENELGLMF